MPAVAQVDDARRRQQGLPSLKFGGAEGDVAIGPEENKISPIKAGEPPLDRAQKFAAAEYASRKNMCAGPPLRIAQRRSIGALGIRRQRAPAHRADHHAVDEQVPMPRSKAADRAAHEP